MPYPDNPPPEFNPRHRIVGAIVMVVLAIVFVPMILKEKYLTTQDPGNGITLPEKDTKVFVSKAEDIRRALIKSNDKRSSNNSIAKDSESVVKNDTRTNKTSPRLLSKVPAKVEKTAPAKSTTPPVKAKPANKPKTTTPKITKGWVVQIGTYSDPANAKRVRASLVRHGYHVRLEKVRLPKGNATRVRVGPFSDRGKAITTLSHIGRDVGLQGVVLRYP